jgi:hypothetical protein
MTFDLAALSAPCVVSEAGPAIGEPRLEHDIPGRRDRPTLHVAGQ